MKIKMASKLLQAYNKGDSAKCAKKDDASAVEAYCNAKFPTNPEQNQNCKVPEDFCFICCDKEFGAMRQTERSDCYNGCTPAPEGAAASPDAVVATPEPKQWKLVD